MIINCSRFKSTVCWRKARYIYHDGLATEKTINLADGSAFHKGVAAGLATKDWKYAKEVAHTQFEEDKKDLSILDEYLLASHLELQNAMIDAYRDGFEQEDYQVIQPECDFDVPLPNSYHNCIFLHHYELVPASGATSMDLRSAETNWITVERWGAPSEEAVREHRVLPAHSTFDPACRCWQPHRLVGKTDALVAFKRNIWLLEHKTTAIIGPQFWNNWLLDIQPTTYIYGIWKATGIRPSGFILNAIYKPSSNQVAAWNKKRVAPVSEAQYIRYERQAFLRSDEDLARVEEQYHDACDEWEERILRGRWPMRNFSGVCTFYNRLCDFHQLCMSHDTPGEREVFARKKPDYVDVKLQDILAASMKEE